MFGQDRNEIRRMFFRVWIKLADRQPLTALESLIADVIEAHPEYHEILRQDEDALERDYLPEGGETNPFLHMGMHIAIREQVSTNRPEGISGIHKALAAKFGDAHEAEHRMLECLGETLWEAQRNNTPPDEQRYLERVRRLL
ncbi:MAG: DUF1841 family protein [Gammaproteobacteria bacterium]|nr:DUF1841 family protein [Gammaproteobacteria bacterium]